MSNTTISTVEILTAIGPQDTAEAAAAKLAKILTGTFLNLREVGACPNGGSFTINVTGNGSERDVGEMALELLANAAIA